MDRSNRDGISFKRLLWVAPLTVGAAVVVNLLIKQLIVTINPELARMGQLQAPLVTLTIQGAVAAVIVFALVAWLLPRPIFWYRIISVAALLLSWIPDIALGLGGAPMMTAMQVVGPLTRLGVPAGPGPGGPGPGGPPPGGGPPGGGGGPPAASWEQVLVLMVLHLATFLVCVGLLTTLTRDRTSRGDAS